MRVVSLEPCHLSHVAALETLCFSEPWSESALQLLCREGAVGVVIPAQQGETAARAYGGMTYVVGLEGSITNIATHPDHRRRGYGRAVVTALIDRARALELAELYLEVRASNEAAIALYRSLGFEVTGQRKNFYRLPNEDAILMRLMLDLTQH